MQKITFQLPISNFQNKVLKARGSMVFKSHRLREEKEDVREDVGYRDAPA